MISELIYIVGAANPLCCKANPHSNGDNPLFGLYSRNQLCTVMSTIDREIYLVPSTKHVLHFGRHFGYLHTKFKNIFIYAIYATMRHYSDPRTDEELRIEYRDVAGTFKSEQGFTFTSKTMIEAGRKVFKVIATKLILNMLLYRLPTKVKIHH